jgi:hypothetical protein
MKRTALEIQEWSHAPCVRAHHAGAKDVTLSRSHTRREPVDRGCQASIAAPAKKNLMIETCCTRSLLSGGNERDMYQRNWLNGSAPDEAKTASCRPH